MYMYIEWPARGGGPGIAAERRLRQMIADPSFWGDQRTG